MGAQVHAISAYGESYIKTRVNEESGLLISSCPFANGFEHLPG